MAVCDEVVQSPEAFVLSLDVPGPSGEQIVSTSPDGAVTSIFRSHGTYYDEIEIYDLGSSVVVDCAVIGEYWGRDHAQLALALAEIVSDQPDLAMIGGHVPVDYVSDGEVSREEDIAFFAVSGAWPGTDRIVIVHIIGGEFQLQLQN